MTKHKGTHRIRKLLTYIGKSENNLLQKRLKIIQEYNNLIQFIKTMTPLLGNQNLMKAINI